MDSLKPVEIADPLPFIPATDRTAQKLLSSQRCRQIEIWLDETVQFKSLQYCATDKIHGHAAGTALTSPEQVCPICNHPFQPNTTLPASTSSTPSKHITTKPKAILRGLKTAMTPLVFAKAKTNSIVVNNSEDETYDPALATKMFFIPRPGKSGLQIDKQYRTGQEGIHPAACSPDASAAELGSSNDEKDGVKRILDERAARLARAQKLLEKSRKKP